MPKAQRFTIAEIEKDIVPALKNPPGIPEASYKKFSLPLWIAAVALVFFPVIVIMSDRLPNALVFLSPLALITYLVVYFTAQAVRVSKSIKDVKISDYTVTEETVESISDEHYRIYNGGKFNHSVPVDNYIVRFENGKTWRIPKDNYLWSEFQMTDFSVFNTTHRGDTFTVVTKKSTGEIAVAYNSEYFHFIQ